MGFMAPTRGFHFPGGRDGVLLCLMLLSDEGTLDFCLQKVHQSRAS